MSTNCPTRTFAHNLTDEELDEHVKGILRLFPTLANVEFWGD